MNRTKIKCELCGQEVSKSNYTKHLRRHENHPETFKEKPYALNHDGLICQFCGKECKNRNSLCNHERLCKENPNRQNVIREGFNNIGRVAWNKGLTKETDERVLKNSESVKSTMNNKIKNGWSPFVSTEEFWTDERKRMHSIQRKEYLKENPEKHPNRILASNRKYFSYLENIVADWLSEHNIEYVRQFPYKFKNSNRFVDFYIPNLNLFIEIDGEFWHSNCKDVDNLKDELALKDGIKTLRISSNDCIIEKLNLYFNEGVV